MSQAVVSEHQAESIGFSRLTSTPLSAVLVAGATALCLYSGLPVWAMFIGWAAYFTRGSTLHDGIYNLACAVTGMGLGIATQSAAVHLDASLGLLALPTAVFLLAISIQLMKFITGVDNIPSYFLGVVVVFAAHLQPSLDTYLTLTAAVSAGALAASVPDFIRQKQAPEE